MPRFYLHVTDGKKTYQDNSGLEAIDALAAEAFARILANDLRADGEFDSYYVDVRDQDGTAVTKVYVAQRH